MKCLVICQFAITSKNMITNIIKTAEASNSDIQVQCASVQEIPELPLESYDVILLAPQVRNYLKPVKERCEPCGIPVDSIDVVAYGLQDANKVLAQIKKLYEKKRGVK